MLKSLTDCYTLSNGVKIPCIGYGTFKTPNGAAVVDSVVNAIRAGYRHIDTAHRYDNEEGVGEGIRKSGIPREEIFVTSKLGNHHHGYKETLEAFDLSLKKLGLDYLDLYLIHWPAPLVCRDVYKQKNAETWRAMEELYHAGKVRAIGLSNFWQNHIDALLETAEVRPMVNQLEIHPQFPHQELLDYCAKQQIQVESWGPLIQGKAFQYPVLKEVGEKHGKTVAQVCVRWALEKGVLPLPKSNHYERMVENADVFDFSLDEEDMKRISSLEVYGRIGKHPDTAPF